MKNILLIDNHDSFTYNLVELLRRLNVPFQVLSVEQVTVRAAADFSHMLISPGPDVPHAYPQLFALLNRWHRQKAILGVCLGHQTLCEFFGGQLYNLPHVRHGQQRTLIQNPDPKVRSNSALFSGLPPQFSIGLYHSWAVADTDFPPELMITARCDEGVIMAMQHRTLPIFGVQFHPESYMSEHGIRLLQNWLASNPQNT